MQYSIGIEYALHCLTYLIHLPKGTSVGVKDLAAFQGVSETYLSKAFTKLKKAGIVHSIPGSKGGYRLAKSPEDITFLDVVEAIEGTQPHFLCTEIRQSCIILQNNESPSDLFKAPCTIHKVMVEAEQKMKDYLKSKTLSWLNDNLQAQLPQHLLQAGSEWFEDAMSRR
ncbi:hypothetical protein AM501_23330 [Aneurinibacillus migulanus]|uniref:RrF2 family transcriptional regulator n=1 Tax=Aneurinibacillus migulanus TaxID=47500 RepID=UPI0005B77407|nr:Rrf2 family transcriptional regulator [Aneurinibacillus migulanus]KIV54625.1 hypothetical protein TS64_16590 [Aneurinibacillus migulanus]KPD05973.1 hypothetical protein AM501_23330 [Aneurinibacillus migulanus]CEH30226.1 Transcriptional regulator, BadM/Rrf2 family [Aneurinibacillus migulanus]